MDVSEFLCLPPDSGAADRFWRFPDVPQPCGWNRCSLGVKRGNSALEPIREPPAESPPRRILLRGLRKRGQSPAVLEYPFSGTPFSGITFISCATETRTRSGRHEPSRKFRKLDLQ